MTESDAHRTLRVDTLIGTHVTMESLELAHVDAIASAASGDRSTFALTSVPDGTDETLAYVEGLLADAASLRVAPFVQRRASDGVVVGCTRFLDPRWTLGRTTPDEVEIGGTWLSADAQRTPVNTEAKLLLMTYAFETWGVGRLQICTDARNARSRAAIERLGATLDGVLPNHRRAWGVDAGVGLRDTAVYSVIDVDWPRVKDGLLERVG